VNAGIFTTPRDVPGRMAPTIAGGAIVALALPVFAVAGWPLAGWALAAVLWVAAEVFGLVLAHLPGRPDNLAAAVHGGMVVSAVAPAGADSIDASSAAVAGAGCGAAGSVTAIVTSSNAPLGLVARIVTLPEGGACAGAR